MSQSAATEMTRVEAIHLRGLVGQLVDVLADAKDDPVNSALARLVPSAYPDDESASAQFRAATQPELLRRRTDDAAVVLSDLTAAGAVTDPSSLTPDEAMAMLTFVLDDEQVSAWMRTLNAVRLVMASRLGIVRDEDHDPEDPRFAVYEWLGYRLDTLVRALTTTDMTD